MADTTASTPNPTLTSLVFSVIRSGLLLASTLGIYHGASVDDGTLMMVASGVVALGTAIWSLVDKFQAAHRQHATAIASSVAGLPVTPN